MQDAGGRSDPVHHAATVFETAMNARDAALSPIVASWRRSIMHHRLDPSGRVFADRLTGHELRTRLEPLEPLSRISAPLLSRLFEAVGNAGCGVLFTDRDGIVIDQRIGDGCRDTFAARGLVAGGDWSEARQGTNGIGTCIAEERPVIIHRDQHFHARNIEISCIGAPVYDPNGRLGAILDVSSCRRDFSPAVADIIAMSVRQTARMIETELFRDAFPGARIVIGEPQPGRGAVLLAVDGDDLVAGATRAARTAFGLSDERIDAGVPASDLLLGKAGGGIDTALRGEIMRAMARAGGNASAAARDLGISRATLYRHMQRLGIPRR